MKGDSCGFLHQLDPERMPVCRSLLKYGSCKETDCLFKHSLDDVKECNMYRLGFCIYGPNCRYKHTRLPGMAKHTYFMYYYLINGKEQRQKSMYMNRRELSVNVKNCRWSWPCNDSSDDDRQLLISFVMTCFIQCELKYLYCNIVMNKMRECLKVS